MKTDGAITILRFIISFLLVATTSSGVVAGENEPVYDNTGHLVRTHIEYKVVPSDDVRRLDGISRFAADMTRPYSCPQKLVYAPLGLAEEPIPPPFIFVSPDMLVRHFSEVYVSTEVNIAFTWGSNSCNDSWFWSVPDSSLPIKEVVLTGLVSSKDGSFILKKGDNEKYMFAFGTADNSTDIGFEHEYELGLGVQRLICSKDAFPFTFSLVEAKYL